MSTNITADTIADAWGYISPWYPGFEVSDAYDALIIDFHDPEGMSGPVNGWPQGPCVVSGADLRRAAREITSGKVQASAVARDIRAGDIDANAADVIVQVAMFGEVVYG